MRSDFGNLKSKFGILVKRSTTGAALTSLPRIKACNPSFHRDVYEGCRLRDRSEQKQNRQKMWVKKGIFAMTSVHEIALEVRINDPSSLGVKVFSVFLDVEHTPGHERSLKRRPSYGRFSMKPTLHLLH